MYFDQKVEFKHNFGCVYVPYGFTTHGTVSNLLDGTRSKANSEGEFFLTSRLDEGDYELQSESESEISSEEDSSFESSSQSEDSTSASEESSDD